MKKETLNEKVIKWFYGIHGTLDEYRRNEVNRIGSNVAIILTLFNLGLVLTAGLMVNATNNYELISNVLVIGLLFIIFAVGGYVIFKTHQLHLTDIDVEKKQFSKAKVHAVKRAFISGLSFGIYMYLLDVVADWLFDQGSFLPILTSITTIEVAIIAGVVFGLLIGLMNLAEIKKY